MGAGVMVSMALNPYCSGGMVCQPDLVTRGSLSGSLSLSRSGSFEFGLELASAGGFVGWS